MESPLSEERMLQKMLPHLEIDLILPHASMNVKVKLA